MHRLEPDSVPPTASLTQSNMASPDVVCQPCGSALGAPTKECSTAHKTLFLAEEMAVGTRPRGYRMRNGRPSAHRKHLTSLRNVRRASGRHDCPSERRRSEKNFGGHIDRLCAGSAAPRCGSRRTCRTAARCSASSSPSAYASVRRSVRRNRSRGHRRNFRQIHADTAFGRHRWFAQGLRLGQDHQPDALQGRRGPRHVVPGDALRLPRERLHGHQVQGRPRQHQDHQSGTAVWKSDFAGFATARHRRVACSMGHWSIAHRPARPTSCRRATSPS